LHRNRSAIDLWISPWNTAVEECLGQSRFDLWSFWLSTIVDCCQESTAIYY